MSAPAQLTTLEGGARAGAARNDGRSRAARRARRWRWRGGAAFGGAQARRAPGAGAVRRSARGGPARRRARRRSGGGALRRRPVRACCSSFPTDANDLLLSGELVGGENMTGNAALVDSPLGKGHVVLFANRPFWRNEPHGNYFLWFNAMLNWNDLGAGR